MVRVIAVVSAVIASSAAATVIQRSHSHSAAAVTPLQKVTQMLSGMLTKGKSAKHAEEVQYAAFKQFCDSTVVEKQRAIKETGDEISMLTADIQVAETDAETHGKHVTQLDADMATFDADQKAATRVREIERADYMKVHQDYSDSIDAIAKAVQVLQAQAYSRPQVASFVQELHALQSSPPGATLRALSAFLSRNTEEDLLVQVGVRSDAPSPALSVDPPEVNAYEFRSQGVIDMLKKLSDKFVDERSALEKEELAKRHAYELLVQDLQKSIGTSKDARAAKVQQKAKQLQSAASMKGQLQDATSTKAVDTKYLSDITSTCTQKAADFKERQQLRADEISAIEKAIEILSSNEVKGTAEKYFPSALLQTSASALVQIRSKDGHPDLIRTAAFLSHSAERLHSHMLSTLALRAREDPFAKVKTMITDMITRLMQQANEEAQHQSWCNTELAENEQMRASRKSQVELLASEIEEKNSLVAKLGVEIEKLSADLTSMAEQLATLQTTRQEEKAANEATVKDAQDAQAAVGQAITVLKEFYARAADATAMVQQHVRSSVAHSSAAKQAPEIFEGAYQGMGDENGGVVAMLEVIQSDYARLESTTNAMEATAQREHDTSVTENAIAKASVEKDIEHKTRQKQTTEQRLVDANNDLATSQKELDAANQYYEKLKPSCIDAGTTFSEREQRRQEEIQSLQEALRILNGEDITAPSS